MDYSSCSFPTWQIQMDPWQLLKCCITTGDEKWDVKTSLYFIAITFRRTLYQTLDPLPWPLCIRHLRTRVSTEREIKYMMNGVSEVNLNIHCQNPVCGLYFWQDSVQNSFPGVYLNVHLLAHRPCLNHSNHAWTICHKWLANLFFYPLFYYLLEGNNLAFINLKINLSVSKKMPF